MDTTRALFEMPFAMIFAVPVLLLLFPLYSRLFTGRNTAKPRRGASVMCILLAAAAMPACLAACTDSVPQEPGAELIRKIEESSGSHVADSVCADFDGDGTVEVFAVTGDDAGELWNA